MPKVVATAKSTPEAAAAAEAATVAVDDVEVPPLPPILPNDDDDDDAKMAAPTSDGEEGTIEPAAAKAVAVNPVTKEDNNSEQTFYAVRVGYAACPNCSASTKNDGEAASSGNGCSHVATIRSAIFLRWEDVQQFVEFQEGAPPPAAATASGVVSVPFHHNVEYKEFNDMERALKYLQKVTPAPSTTKKSSSSTAKTSAAAKTTKIRSLHRNKANMPIHPPLKNFNPPTKKWESMYQSALEYKSTHGHLDMPSSTADASEEDKELFKWVKYQRTSYKAYLEDPMGRSHSMTTEKVNRLKEAGFDWIVEDKKKWLSEETTTSGSGDGKKKRGRPRKSEASSSEEDKRNKASAESTTKKRCTEVGHSYIKQNKFKCLGTTEIQGSVSIISHDGEARNVVCHGYLVSAASNDPDHMMIVLDVDGKMTPCLCPRYLIDFEVPASVQYIEDKRANNYRASGIVTANNVLVTSKPAQREDGVHGQLIVDGPLKGRVVDETMLESLHGGCLRIGSYSSRGFYTIDRRYTINEMMLKNAARVIIASQSDGRMKLTPVGSEEVASIISIAQVVLRCKSVRHGTLSNAISELQQAGTLPPPSLNETLLQISMGGNSSPQAMMIGQFLPCAGLSAHPNIAVRCACGFTVDGMKKGKAMLRRSCKKHVNNKQ